eukprot:TRINITY_DN3617_c0_g1_i1.p1 TRINITY_DN3617_c0_g1~~TRINITY_DN3617_c0_g1_i1.p1  ORF type:complete len:448 (+),score=102.51 TRINITY_DN3617_c0_g1_i1:47-1390(+)
MDPINAYQSAPSPPTEKTQLENPVNDLQAFVAYPARWHMLALFCLISVANAITWITFSPISDKVEEKYDVSFFWVNALSLVFMAVYIPVFFLASWTLDTYPLRYGLCIGAGLTAIGAWIRVGGDSPDTFWLVMLGQVVAAIAQPFILNAPPKVVATWFPENQRTMGTTIASVANPIGVAFGFILPPAFAGDKDDIPFMLLVEAIICSVAFILFALLFKNNPPTPPSASQMPKDLENMSQSIRALMTDREFWIIFIEFGIGLGAFNSLATLINQILEPYGYTNDDSGTVGALVVFIGLIGAGIAGAAVDKTKKYKLVLVICLGSSSLLALWWTLALKSDNLTMLALVGGLLGGLMTPIMPVSLELGCEIAYPIGEALPSGLLMTAGQIFGIVMVVVMGLLIDEDEVVWANWIVVISIGVAFVAMGFFKGELKRSNHDKRALLQDDGSN